MNTATAQPVPLTLPDVPQKTVQKQNAALSPVTADLFPDIKILSENLRKFKKEALVFTASLLYLSIFYLFLRKSGIWISFF